MTTIDAVINSLYRLYKYQGKSFAIVLHGGEPFLLPKKRLEYLLQGLREKLPDYTTISIQTNGLLLTNKLIDLCYQYDTTISISLDGDKKTNDLNRIDHKKHGSYERIIEKINLIKNHPHADVVFTGLLAVIDPFSDPKKTYHFFKQLDIPSVNFLMRDGNHDRFPFGKKDFTSIEYGKWLAYLWQEYFNDPNPKPIAVFDDVIKLLLGGESTKEGSGTNLAEILIIDTNGEITKNDTLKSTVNGADKFTQSWNINECDIIDLINSEEYREYIQLQRPTSIKCQSCELLNICGGGMPLYRWSSEKEFDNPSVFCHDHQHIIHTIDDTLRLYYEN